MEKIDKKFLQILEDRFGANMHRHKTIKWDFVESSLTSNLDLYKAVLAMEESGGEPDLIDLDVFRGLVYVDMSKESPSARGSICYDEQARSARKTNPPSSSAMAQAEKMGIRILDEDQYTALAGLEEIDTKSSSWILTPESIRNQGGALFGSMKYGRIFIFHNGADSYYKNRAFRGFIKI